MREKNSQLPSQEFNRTCLKLRHQRNICMLFRNMDINSIIHRGDVNATRGKNKKWGEVDGLLLLNRVLNMHILFSLNFFKNSMLPYNRELKNFYITNIVRCYTAIKYHITKHLHPKKRMFMIYCREENKSKIQQSILYNSNFVKHGYAQTHTVNSCCRYKSQ